MTSPFPACYWVVPGKLLAGEYPRMIEQYGSVKRMQQLRETGVRTFIDLTQDVDGLLPYDEVLAENQQRLRFPVRDLSVPESAAQTLEILNAIDASMERGDIAYVHCWGGVGRTGTIIGCWLARHGHEGESALDRLSELWQDCIKAQRGRRSPETREQEQYVLQWMEA